MKNDWILTIKEDKLKIGLKLTDEQIKNIKKKKYKKLIKEKIRNTAFEELNKKKVKHSKVTMIKYEYLSVQI